MATSGSGGRSRIAAVHLFGLPLECAFPLAASLTEPVEPPWAALEARLAAVRGEAHGQRVLAAVTRAARARGVSPGMTESEALARVPELKLADREPSFELARLSSAAERLFAFGPTVELAPPAFLYVEIGRSRRALARRVGEGEEAIARAIAQAMAEAGHQASVAVASDADTARTLAQQLSARLTSVEPAPRARARARHPRSVAADSARRATSETSPSPGRVARVAAPRPAQERAAAGGGEVWVVPAGEESRAARSLPLEALGWTELAADPRGELRARLRAAIGALRTLGVHDVGALARLAPAQLTARFADAGALLSRRARAQAARPLRPFTPPDRLLEELELERAIDDLEPVLFLLRRLFGALEARLDARQLAIGTLRIAFLLEPGLGTPIDVDACKSGLTQRRETLEFSFARPTRNAAIFLAVARERLQGALPGAVRAVWVEALAPAADRGSQLELFSAHARRLEAAGELLERLRAALGEQALFSPALVDTHRPEQAWRTVAFDVERALAEPPPPRPERPAAEAPRAAVRADGPSRVALPAIDAALEVTAVREGPRGVPSSEPPAQAWPRPVKRPTLEEASAPLPPRPLELFETPEPATLMRGVRTEDGRARDEPEGEGVLLWRGQRHRVLRLLGPERLEAEWWTSSPVARDYLTAELADGRRLWMFRVPSGALSIHGVFD